MVDGHKGQCTRGRSDRLVVRGRSGHRPIGDRVARADRGDPIPRRQQPRDPDRVRSRRVIRRSRKPATLQIRRGGFRLETIFDWRGYFGPKSATIDGSNEMQPDGRGFVARLRGRAGYVIGRVLRRLTFGQPTLHRGPLAIRRQRAALTEYPVIAQSCPLLSDRNPVTDKNAMVFVHGTASCGLQET